MDLIIYCYGYSELMFHVLQGIAMFRESAFYGTVINTMALTIGVFYSWQMALSRVDGQWRHYILKVFGMLLFINALLLPTASMIVKDHVEKRLWQVDHIPLAFALPIGIIENFGHLITMGFEQTFSRVGSKSSLMYYHYGTIFGARLSKEVLQAKIRDPEVVGNMRNFIQRCVMLPAMIGHQFTKEELASTHDIWGLVSKNAGTLTRTDMIVNGKRLSPSPTCEVAVRYFEGKFQDQEKGLISTLSQKFRGAGSTIDYNSGQRQLNQNIAGAILGLYNGEHKVDTVLRNNMMINSINSYRSGKYATARAQMHQEAGGLMSADMADKILICSLTVAEIMSYGSFIFILPLLVLNGWVRSYKLWLTGVLSLALWPPLFSLLNMIMDFAYEPGKVVSYSTWSTEMNKFDSIASTAGWMVIAIPLIAGKLTSMGEGFVSSVAGTIMAGGSAAVSAISGEKASGTRSWDNDNISNSSRDNSTSSKTNHNMEYVTGEQSWNNAEGARVKMAATGQQIITGGAGITADVGETRYGIEDSRRGEVNAGAQRSREIAAADTRTLTNAKSNTFAETKDWIKNLAEREVAGQTNNYESMGEQGENVQKMVSTVKTLAGDYGYSYDQAVEGALTGNISASSPLKNIVGGVSIGADGRISAGNKSSQSFNEREQAENSKQLQENYNSVLKAASTQSHSSDQTVDKSKSSRVSSAYEEQQRAESALAKSYHEAESWHQAQNVINSSGGTSSKDMTKDVIDRYMKDSGITDRNQAHKHVSERTPAVMRTWNKMLSEDNYVQNLVNDIANTKASVAPEAATRKLNTFSDNNELDSTEANNDKVEQAASANGFNGNKIEKNIAEQKKDITTKATDMKVDNNTELNSAKKDIKTKTNKAQAVINEFERKRIGQDPVSQILSDFTHVRGFGNLINPVGGPQKDSVFGNNTIGNSDAKPQPAIDMTSFKTGNGKPINLPKAYVEEYPDLAPDWQPYTGNNTYGLAPVEANTNKRDLSGLNGDGQKVDPDLTGKR